MAAYLDPPDAISIEAGAHIDPEGHNLYNPQKDGQAMACVPLNVSETMQRLHEALNSKQYTSRALEHCRKLLLLFLAGKQNGTSLWSRLFSSSELFLQIVSVCCVICAQIPLTLGFLEICPFQEI